MNNTLPSEEWMIRYLAGSLTDDECRAIVSWLNESPENGERLFILKDIYEALAQKRLFDEAATEEGWKQLQNRIKQQASRQTKTPFSSRRQVWRAVSRYAAALLVGVLATAIWTSMFREKGDLLPDAVSTYGVETKKGERATITLPDGSTVKLNACSRLAYHSNYETNREVSLTGEAYFDVHTNPELPFTVKASGLNIKAYGTSFNVKAYADEDRVETTLVKGIVNIGTTENPNMVALKPNQVVSIPKSFIHTGDQPDEAPEAVKASKPADTPKDASPADKPVQIHNVNPDVYTSWKDDKWHIQSESMESLAKKMERKYDITIRIEDPTAKQYVFSGTLRNYPLEQVLELIRLNAPIQYSIREKTVVIREDKRLKKQYEKLIPTSKP